MKLKIRLMQNVDIQKLSEIYTLVYEELNIGEKWTIETSKKLIEYWYNKQPDLAFVAEYEREIVGAFIVGAKPWWDGMHLVDGELFVNPKFQKLGIGTELSKKMYEAALEKYNVVSFDSYTFKKTKFPLNWYKSQGFKENEDWVMIEGDVKSILSNLKN